MQYASGTFEFQGNEGTQRGVERKPQQKRIRREIKSNKAKQQRAPNALRLERDNRVCLPQ